ncbi:S1 family peptidase [Vibrio kanaloae]|uniref:S1 family peptidase n=1 Tax=Vibrio kanaloae TaxID=170673 RepID=UPI00098939F0|nr:serine protease [Vibrio kanaloae]QPK03555.1 trypsin-like peptidase domain-containing protein [Vibrio kanaloae]
MSEVNLKSATCKITCGNESGTGFFISSKKIITASHVINEYFIDETEIKVSNCHGDNKEHKARYVSHNDEAHIVVIELDDYLNENYLELVNADILKGERVYIYGYPKNHDGEIIGEPLSGNILRYIEENEITIHDVNITVDNFDNTSSYDGFSGSPVVNSKSQVLSFIRFKNERYLSSVSIKKSRNFLDSQKINYFEDGLNSFDDYKNIAFNGFEGMKIICEEKSKKPLILHPPIKILEKKVEKIFYPNEVKCFEDIRVYLKNNREIDKNLWVGWAKFLTYVQIMEGNLSNIEGVNVTVSFEVLFKSLGFIKRKKFVDQEIKFELMFTENESFIKVASEVMERSRVSEDLSESVCNVFNSNSENFGIRRVNSKNIVNDIGKPDGAVPSVVRPKTGVVSLRQLTDIVINSDTLEDAKVKLKEAIEDAIS